MTQAQMSKDLQEFLLTLPPECQEDFSGSTVWSASSMQDAQDLLAWVRGLAVTAGRSCAIASITGKPLCGFQLNGDAQRALIFPMKVWK